MYRATLALIARRRRDGLAASPLLQQARTTLYRATVMSSRRHGIHDSPSPVSRCAGQDGDLIGRRRCLFSLDPEFFGEVLERRQCNGVVFAEQRRLAHLGPDGRTVCVH